MLVLAACQAPPPGASSSAKNEEGTVEPTKARLATDDAVRDAYLEATGATLDDNACIARPTTFDEVVVVGRSIVEGQCVLTGAFVREQWSTGDVAVVRGLATRGWSDAAAPLRRQLALAWTRDVMYAFGPPVLETAPPPFAAPKAPKFTPPFVESGDAGETMVTVWLQETPTADGSARYGRQRLTYSVDGTLTTQRIQRFVAPPRESGGDEVGAGTPR